MSPRFYLFSAIIVTIMTIGFSWWKQKKTVKDILIVFGQVAILWVLIFGAVFALAELLEYMGIAKSGFIIKGEKLK